MAENRWRSFEEDQAVGGWTLRLIARLAPRPPRASWKGPAARPGPAMRATVSVVIPCYNYARYLPDAVHSALAQQGVDVEVIVVDDRSTDDSRRVADRLAACHPEVRVISNQENLGHVRSFNVGWEASIGEFTVKLDADDLLAPDALGRAVALFEAHPSVGLVYGHPRHFASDHPPAARVDALRWVVWRGEDWLMERCRLGVSAITNPEMVLRSSLLRQSGPMDPSVAYAPDMEIALRLATISDIGYIEGADQALHREHADSMSETDGAGLLVDLQARRAAFERALGVRRDSAEFRDRARAALARDALRLASAAADRTCDGAPREDLVEFAIDVCPESRGWRSYRRLGAASPAVVRRLSVIGRRAGRRIRSEAYFARWMVSGV
ncbi:GT2 family glycosyltransferase [Microbacterium trichothecenolyticum]|uniref:glycosyltransferase family 2 protein n=1 Tax=Microbacterium trichothecenolyticum TaxID=69370 RepID=UPI0028586B9E|nr:glycosyltransferase family 2 protein [Microbacterium trichothecenolyticum]MDR7110838.1 GT2 family glycosyltransferase [Microbacterium trichothecenolyticum]